MKNPVVEQGLAIYNYARMKAMGESTGKVDVTAGTEPGTVWVQINNHDEEEGALPWAELSIFDARVLGQKLIMYANAAQKDLTTVNPKYR